MYCVCLHTYCLVCTPCVSCTLCASCACTRCIWMPHELYTTLYPLKIFSFLVGNANWTCLLFTLFFGEMTKVGMGLGSLGSECDQDAFCKTPKEEIKKICWEKQVIK